MGRSCESRRAFLADAPRLLAAAGLATVVARVDSAVGDDKGMGRASIVLSIDTADPANAALKKLGGAVYLENPKDRERPIIVLRKGENDARAFSSRCTHKGGPLSLPNAEGISVCGWHKAAFDANGAVKNGPAKNALPMFRSKVENGVITVVLS